MSRVPAIALLAFLAVAVPCICRGQPSGYIFKSLDEVIPGSPKGAVQYDFATGAYSGTNILIQQGNATLMADEVTFDPNTGIAVADGHVRIEQAGETWLGNHITYNLKTHQMDTGLFRAGKTPYFVQGGQIQANTTNHTYMARNVRVSTDNISTPAYYIRASRMVIVPGQYMAAWNAVLYVEGVPSFYFPYYRRNLKESANNFNVMPGDDSFYGPFILGIDKWRLNKEVDGQFHLDYRAQRGPGLGPDLNLHLNQWGETQIKYYYLNDRYPDASINDGNFQNLSPIPNNRQRFYLGWNATPYTNVETKALVNYQSDQLILHDYFQGDYGENPQPNTFIEGDKHWDNWSLDAYTTPRINSFFDQVERLPEAQLTGFRQQIFNTPVYYESQSSVGYYSRYFAGTNTLFGALTNTSLDFEAPRADTFQQLLLPETFFGWLNVTPRVGARATWYGTETGPGGTNAPATRYVLNTGIDTSFKVSRLWPDATNWLLNVDGIRHVIEPSVSYAFVPEPNLNATQLPQFDTQLPSLMVLPIEFPDYNDIDAIQSENVVRFGLRNTLQTKRNGQLDNLLDWNLMLDWNLTPNSQTNSVFLQPQKTFDDLYSDLIFKPRPWIALESQLRYDINYNNFNMSFFQVTFTPSDRWSWSIGHWYLRNGFIDTGDNVITSTLFYRLNENWGVRATQYYNAMTGILQQQNYTLYRDMRSFTAGLTFRLINNGGGQPLDYGFAVSISLKALPLYRMGQDTIAPYTLLGQ